MSRICPLSGEKVIYLTCQDCDDKNECDKNTYKEISYTEGRQMIKTLPAKEAQTLLVELMHQGYDTFCSEKDIAGNLTVIWPASINIGKQLPQNKAQKVKRPLQRKLSKEEEKEYDELAEGAVQLTLDQFIKI